MKISVTDQVFHNDVRAIAGQFSYEDESGVTKKRIPTDTDIDAVASADKVAEILRVGYSEVIRRAVPFAEIDFAVTVSDEDGINLFTEPNVRLRGGSPADIDDNIDLALKLRAALLEVKKIVLSVPALDRWQVLKTV